MTSLAAATVIKASMFYGKRSKVWLHFSKCDADYARCNICKAKCKASGGNTSNLRKHLVKHKIFLASLRSTARTSAIGDNAKCEIGDKETALRLLQDIQLVTLPEPSSTSLWSDSSQSQSPMPVIGEVTTVSNPEPANDPGSVPSSAFPPAIQSPFIYTSSSVTDKYDFLPGSEKLLSNPNAHQHSAWQFFGLEPDPTGRPLDRNMAVCKLCMERVSCGGGATDLQNHLTTKHHLKPRDITKDRILA
ncbi:hypothetical protein ILYODFUR_021741, partial [Ilyodon furcidens]